MKQKKLMQIVSFPMDWVYYYLLILSLISNYIVLTNDEGILAVLSILGFSVVTAYVEALVYKALPGKFLQMAFLCVVAVIHNAVCITDYFILINFQRIINQDIIDILGETNPDEISNFSASYLQFHKICPYVIAAVLINYVAMKVSKHIVRLRLLRILNLAILLWGCSVAAYTCVNFALYRNGMSMPQRTALTRLGYSYYIMKQRRNDVERVYNLCRNIEVSQITPPELTFVVIIGESFSLYHSELYGYDKPTNPLLSQLKNDSSLLVYDNVVSIGDHTHDVMKSIYSLSSLNSDFGSYTLFPAYFRKMGYHTALYDNQYFVGKGITFLSNKKLSEYLFSDRNNIGWQYDGDMIEQFKKVDTPALYIFHLYGQHYTYSNRYPEQFRTFTANDYDKSKYSTEQRDIIAHYDNATLYNDYVINKIINKFKDIKCCILYFSDHGEEVYECRDYMGHGNAAQSPDLKYQIHIPFMIWLSPSFKESNPFLAKRLRKTIHYPISTDDFPHLILDLANIKTEDLDSTRSFINQNYLAKKHRIVLNSIDYDKTVLSSIE